MLRNPFLGLTSAAFKPDWAELRQAVNDCIKISEHGDCSKGPHGPIQEWDVSAATDMLSLFSHRFEFDQDLSKWDVSAATNMELMFSSAYVFNQDLSKWDVSSVTNMMSMFLKAAAFNQDLSKWDVSKVTYMTFMFSGTSAFKRELCGAAWVNSKANKNGMFLNSPGAISSTACTTAVEGHEGGVHG